MKKFILIFLLAASMLYAQTAEEQLYESNIVLAMAFEKITALEEEVKELKAIKVALEERLDVSTDQLIESNEVLSIAYKRIEADENEITRLRDLLDKAVAMLEKNTNFYTISIFPIYTIGKNFGGGISFNTRLASLPINVLSGATASLDGISLFAGLGYSF